MGSKRAVHIITSYYPPETGAASNRIFSLSRKLKEAGYEVEVTTPLPNYPEGRVREDYKGKFRFSSQEDGIIVNRVWLFASNSSNKLIRLFSMLSYGISVILFLLFHKTPKLTIIQCSPLLTGFCAILVSKLKNKTIVTNVSDLWPLAGAEMGLLRKGSLYYRVLESIEKYIYRNSHALMGQSNEILQHIRKTLKTDKDLFLYRNFPEFNPPDLPETKPSKEIHIVYAGLLGVAQGIKQLVENIQLPQNMHLHLYGAGPETEAIKRTIADIPRIEYKGSLERSTLHEKLVKYDATLVPLKNRIYGSVPSKIFEYARLGLPIIFYSNGEGANIVEQFEIGVTCRNSEVAELNTQLRSIEQEKTCLPSKQNVRKIAEQNFILNDQFSDFDAWLSRLG